MKDAECWGRGEEILWVERLTEWLSSVSLFLIGTAHDSRHRKAANHCVSFYLRQVWHVISNHTFTSWHWHTQTYTWLSFMAFSALPLTHSQFPTFKYHTLLHKHKHTHKPAPRGRTMCLCGDRGVLKIALLISSVADSIMHCLVCWHTHTRAHIQHLSPTLKWVCKE